MNDTSTPLAGDLPEHADSFVAQGMEILQDPREDALVYDPQIPPNLADARERLRQVYGYQAFRPGQETIVEAVFQGRDVLGVMPTGSGKSICYQIPALMLPGTTLVISPLISLMKDQVSALRGRGIAASCLNSNMTESEYQQTVHQVLSGGCKVLYVAPERLAAPGFLHLCAQLSIPYVAVDEAHCVSQWGQDFRPSYLKIADFIRQLPERPVLGAFTATATPRVERDILDYLGLKNPVRAATGFDRPNLSFSVYQPRDKDQTLTELLRDRYRQSGIVYCSTRKNVEAVCELLKEEGFAATRYHAGLSAEERAKNQEDFLFDRQRVMVATNAFGMGIDKSNVSYVIHYNMPQSLEAYYQEAGRAGRDGCDADCILLYSPQDVMTARWLIQHGDPNPDLSEEEQAEVRKKDEDRLKWMTFYAKSKRCLRGDILRYFGERPPERCGNCSNCVPDCEHVDITTEAQMILSCVARTNMQLRRDVIIDLLRGIQPAQPPEGFSTEELSTFGLMKDTREELLQAEIQALCDQGAVDLSQDAPGVLLLNDLSREILFQNRRVVMRRGVKTGQGNVKLEKDETDLFQALISLRYEISGRELIAASTLFSNGALREICVKLPRDKKQLAAIDGMGLYKASRYGDQILSLVNQYAPPEKNREEKAEQKKRTFQDYMETLQRRGKTEAYQPWSEEEDSQLIREVEEGLSKKEISEIHKRTSGAIQSRIKKLKLE